MVSPRNCVWLVLLLAVILTAPIDRSSADTFGSGPSTFTIDFVTVGSPGNPPDANPNPAGAVPYVYRIAKYEVSEQMIDKANALGGLGITIDARGPDKPATSVTWFEAARFVNWLNESTGHVPAYKFDAAGDFQLWEPLDPGYDAANLYRNAQAKYFLPSLNEWHKAAYYDPIAGHYWDYPTGSDVVPDGIDFPGDTTFDAVFFDGGANSAPNIITDVGLASPLGTLGQGGNVREWIETATDTKNTSPFDTRIFVGGSLNDHPNLLLSTKINGINPFIDSGICGFRIASLVPEQSSIALTLVATSTLVLFHRYSYLYRSPMYLGRIAWQFT